MFTTKKHQKLLQLKDREFQLKDKEFQLKDKELQLKEKELQLKEKELQTKGKELQIKENEYTIKEKEKEKEKEKTEPQSENVKNTTKKSAFILAGAIIGLCLCALSVLVFSQVAHRVNINTAWVILPLILFFSQTLAKLRNDPFTEHMANFGAIAVYCIALIIFPILTC